MKNQWSLRAEWWRFVLLLLPFLAAPVGAEVVGARPIEEPLAKRLYIYEGETLSWQWSELGAGDGRVIGGPAFMQFHPVEGGFELRAPSQRTGRDRVAIEIFDKNGQSLEVLISIDIRVYPAISPIFGHFKPGHPFAGYFDAKRGRFVLCGAAPPGEPLLCDRSPVKGLEAKVRIPIALPEGSRDRLALFSPATGMMDIYELDLSGQWVVQDQLELKDAIGGWPLVGDFDGDKDSELAVVHDHGEVVVIDTEAVWWAAKLNIPDGEMLVWPVLWLLEGHASDGIALFPPAGGFGFWMAGGQNSSAVYGSTWTWLEDTSRPVLVSNSWSGTSDQIYFLQVVGNSIEFWPLPRDGKPGIIPVKFPDDPPGGGGAG